MLLFYILTLDFIFALVIFQEDLNAVISVKCNSFKSVTLILEKDL